MNSKIKNIIILVVVAIVLILIYIFFIKKGPVAASLTSSTGASLTPDATSGNGTPNTNDEFVSILLSVKNLKLDDSIFKDPAFLSLQDSSITLIQDGTEGRPNPFAPIGTEITPSITIPPTTPPTTPPTIPPTIPPVTH